MAKSFKLLLSSPDAVLFDKEIESVSFETPDGEITVMADHVPVVTLVNPGIMSVKSAGKEELLSVGAGFARSGENELKVFAQTAEFVESIDEQRAIEARKQAEALIRENKDQVSLADAISLLERNIARLKTIERKKRRAHN